MKGIFAISRVEWEMGVRWSSERLAVVKVEPVSASHSLLLASRLEQVKFQSSNEIETYWSSDEKNDKKK